MNIKKKLCIYTNSLYLYLQFQRLFKHNIGKWEVTQFHLFGRPAYDQFIMSGKTKNCNSYIDVSKKTKKH